LNVGDEVDVRYKGREFVVQLMVETVTRSYYWVAVKGTPWRAWKGAAEVQINARSEMVCTRCRQGSRNPCVHIEILRTCLAGQPLEPIPNAAPTTRDLMLAELAKRTE
jgi:hypothetical protein